jgi:hypothetical protein
MAQADLVGGWIQHTGHPVMVVAVVKRVDRETIQASTGIAVGVDKSEKFWPVFMN